MHPLLVLHFPTVAPLFARLVGSVETQLNNRRCLPWKCGILREFRREHITIFAAAYSFIVNVGHTCSSNVVPQIQIASDPHTSWLYLLSPYGMSGVDWRSLLSPSLSFATALYHPLWKTCKDICQFWAGVEQSYLWLQIYVMFNVSQTGNCKYRSKFWYTRIHVFVQNRVFSFAKWRNISEYLIKNQNDWSLPFYNSVEAACSAEIRPLFAHFCWRVS